MGAHPKGPAKAKLNSHNLSLDQLIAEAPVFFLGKDTADRFSERLPFLFKILDVRSMLSIQAHPNKKAAEAGFARENALGIPLDAPHRVFRDDNHKPEVMVALTDFWLLHGFTSQQRIGQLPEIVPEFSPLSDLFRSGDLRELYRQLMTMPQEAVNHLLSPLAERLQRAQAEGILTESHPEYWAAQAFEEYTSAAGDYDRGIFSIFLMNLVHVPPGMGIYQGAGIPHAYLRGVNVELMANSDNVFRGGLTPKHVDVGALMEHLEFQAVDPELIKGHPGPGGLITFPSPAPDFRLSQLEITSGQTYRIEPEAGPRIFIIMDGSVSIGHTGDAGRGSITYLCPGVSVTLTAHRPAKIFLAGVPAAGK